MSEEASAEVIFFNEAVTIEPQEIIETVQVAELIETDASPETEEPLESNEENETTRIVTEDSSPDSLVVIQAENDVAVIDDVPIEPDISTVAEHIQIEITPLEPGNLNIETVEEEKMELLEVDTLNLPLEKIMSQVLQEENEETDAEKISFLNPSDQEKIETEVGKFAIIHQSDDSAQPLPITTRLMNSPKPKKLHDFVNVNYNVDDDLLQLQMGLTMSRSGSLESLPSNNDYLFFSSLDRDKEFPRPMTPTKETAILHASKSREMLIDTKGSDEKDLNNESKPEEKEMENSEIPAVEEIKIERDQLIAMICVDLEQKEKLQSRNILLQNKLADYFRKKRIDENRENEKSAADQEQRYTTCMIALNELQLEGETINNTNKKTIADYQAKLEEKVKEANEKVEQFWKYKLSVASSAQNSRTGKSIAQKVIDQLENTERKKDAEVVGVRLENIKLRNKLKRHEQLLRQKEELADGLHLIDFEQLKIENQTYNEKIEERNEELIKLRRKITNVVQVLTHVKEKLQFVQSETVSLKSKLKILDEEVNAKRDSLPIIKLNRDKYRANNILLRQKNGLLGNEKLLIDYGNNMDATKQLREEIENLQNTYNELVSESVLIRRKIQKSQMIAQLRTDSGHLLS